MSLPRARLAGLLATALLCAAVLSGCGGSEPTTAAALAHSGVVDGLFSELKQKDDEAEVREIQENAPNTREEREEDKEAAEEAQMAGAPQMEANPTSWSSEEEV